MSTEFRDAAAEIAGDPEDTFGAQMIRWYAYYEEYLAKAEGMAAAWLTLHDAEVEYRQRMREV